MGFGASMMKCAEPSLEIVLKTYAGSGPTEIPPSLIEACVAVRDQLVDAARRGKLSERQGDLLDAMTRLIRSAPTIESLVEIAMAIAYDVGRAQGQSGIVADLAQARGVSRQHADRQIKRGRVLLAFHKSGKSLSSPTGRKVEMLAELPEEHWIPGWEFVVSKAEKKGKVSDKDAETFVEVYKYQNTLHPPELASPSAPAHVPDEEQTAEDQGQKPAEKTVKALPAIPAETAALLFDFLSPRARKSLAASVRRGNPIHVGLGVFRRIAKSKMRSKAAKDDGFFNALRKHDPVLAQNVEKWAFSLVIDEFSRQVEQYCRRLDKAAEDYRSHHPEPRAI